MGRTTPLFSFPVFVLEQKTLPSGVRPTSSNGAGRVFACMGSTKGEIVLILFTSKETAEEYRQALGDSSFAPVELGPEQTVELLKTYASRMQMIMIDPQLNSGKLEAVDRAPLLKTLQGWIAAGKPPILGS